MHNKNPQDLQEESSLLPGQKTRKSVREAMLYSNVKNAGQKGVIRCQLCSHYCLIPNGQVGKCLVRQNENGKLYSLSWGKASGLAMDPIEKKPFFHFKPGSSVLSFGTPGCNFRCLNCQNWDLSQGVSIKGKSILEMLATITPKQIALQAQKSNADAIAYTYSEPTIFFEYAYDTIKECKKQKETKNISHLFVSNGYFSKEAFELIKKEKLLDAIRIDLKFFDDEKYYEITGGRLKPVLESITRVHQSGTPLEIINLLIPDENDSDAQIEKLCKFVYSLSPNVPLHFSRFFPYYKLANKPETPIKTLLNARKIAKEIGLNYVYIGNTDLKDTEDTRCPQCNLLLIKRNRYIIEKNVFEKLKDTKNPKCPKCGYEINLVL
ncbi:MAG: AmmeMemoRadiSam system radical SAM enzyme [Candidatus Micrarchaeia archaeon]